MAIKQINAEFCALQNDYKREFIVDSDADFANLPKSCTGSTAISPSGNIRIVNASGEWVAFGGQGC